MPVPNNLRIRKKRKKVNASLGVFAVVKPNGTDKNGLRNAEKMGYLEYGVRSHGQEPRPVRAAAVAQSENAVMQVMEEVIGAEVDKL